MADNDDPQRGVAGDGRDSPDKKDDKKDASCPMVDKKTLLDNLPSLATVTLLGVTAINVLTSNQSLSGDTAKYKGLRQFLLSMPYAVFLFAFAGMACAVAVKRKPHMLGCATGILLVQLVCLIVMGGIVTLVRGEVDLKIVWPVTGGIVVLLVVLWSILCAYPKFLRRLFCCCSKKEKDKIGDEQSCKTCGGVTINGRSPNPAHEGAQPCESCGGVLAPASGQVPTDMSQMV